MRRRIMVSQLAMLIALAFAPTLGFAERAAASHAAVIKEDLRVTLSDGVELAVRVYRPDDTDPHPVQMSFSPYGSAREPGAPTEGNVYFPRDYDGVRVFVDVRGSGASSGTFCLLCEREQQDAHDMIEWAANALDLSFSGGSGPATWSNGRVAVWGQSYGAILGLLAAAKDPAGLQTVVAHSAASELYREAAWHNGMLNQFFIAQWAAYQARTSGAAPTHVDTQDPTTTDLEELAGLAARLSQRAGNERIIDTILANPYYNAVYKERSVYDVRDQIDIPVLLIDGWQDGFSKGAIRNLEGIPNARLLMSPYGHQHGGVATSEPQADRRAPEPVADRPVKDYSAMRWAIYDAWLEQHLFGSRERTDALTTRPVHCDIDRDWKICYFDRGAKMWKEAAGWPLPNSGVHRYFLAGGDGPAPNAGALVAQPPTGAASTKHSFAYDPTAGVTETFGKWGNVAATPQISLDQNADEARALSFTTAPLETPLEIAGPIELRFFASTTAPDTDWVVKVSRVSPDGASRLMSSGYLRASQRKWDEALSRPGSPWITNTEEDAAAPGEGVNEYRIDVWDIAWTLQPGERLRVSVSSGDSPNHTPSPWAAVNTIYHNEQYPSRLLLTSPGAPRDEPEEPETKLEIADDALFGNEKLDVTARIYDWNGTGDISQAVLRVVDANAREIGSWSLTDFVVADDQLELAIHDLRPRGPSPWRIELVATDSAGYEAAANGSVGRMMGSP